MGSPPSADIKRPPELMAAISVGAAYGGCGPKSRQIGHEGRAKFDSALFYLILLITDLNVVRPGEIQNPTLQLAIL
jgi:hypothetical protein